MSNDQAVHLATQLHKLGVSHAGVVELLSQYPFEEIERQLLYLPYRKAKRPEAMIIEAVRNHYTPPKEFYYAQTETAHPNPQALVDKNSQPSVGQTPAGPQGLRTEGAPRYSETDERFQPGGQSCDLALPPAHEADGKSD